MTDQPNISDDDISSTGPTEADDNRDKSGEGPLDTGDAPTEDNENRDTGAEGEGEKDTGDLA
jgi:hypothetical protein